MSVVVLTLTRQQAGDIEIAMQLHARVLDRKGRPDRARALDDFQHLAGEIGRDGGEIVVIGSRPGTDGGKSGDTEGAGGDSESRTTIHELLTQRHAAGLLGLHPRTIRRAIDRGDLAATPTAGGRRVSRYELERYAAAREVQS